MFKTLGNRIEKAIKSSAADVRDVAAACDVSVQAVYGWMRDEVKDLRNANLFALADLTGFSARWIGTGEGAEIERYSSAAIKHVVQVMESLPADDQDKLSRMADAFQGPPASNDHQPHATEQRRLGGS